VTLDHAWGLDHGTWSVLRHLLPEADIPVVQLSLDAGSSPAQHYALGQRLAPLRSEEVLIIGTGNLVHNLRAYVWDGPQAPAADWAMRFELAARRLILAGNHGPLLDYERIDPEARRAVPTPDHYLPLLYVLALQDAEDKVSFPVEGIDGGTISMLAVQIG
jgi:4,5-DOPA dioxygenase extradiol